MWPSSYNICVGITVLICAISPNSLLSIKRSKLLYHVFTIMCYGWNWSDSSNNYVLDATQG